MQDQCPYLFLPDNAPKELEYLFYKKPTNIPYRLLSKTPIYCKFLLNVHLENVMDDNDLTFSCPPNQHTVGFVEYYTSHYGNEAFLQLVIKYGELLDHDFTFDKEPNSKEEFEIELMKYIYNFLLFNSSTPYINMLEKNNIEFMNAYPGMFINYDEIPIQDEHLKKKFYASFYSRYLNLGYIFDHPELVNALKNKDLHIIFGAIKNRTSEEKTSTYELIDILGNETFLNLCATYGDYLHAIDNNLDKSLAVTASLDELKNEIEKIIAHQIKTYQITYDPYNCPVFLREKNTELFLSDDAPAELKSAYYKNVPNFTFEFIADNPEYHPYLKDKYLFLAIKEAYISIDKETLLKYFEIFDSSTAFKLIVQKPTTIYEIIKSNQVEKIKIWYEATGRKFIPEYRLCRHFQ